MLKGYWTFRRASGFKLHIVSPGKPLLFLSEQLKGLKCFMEIFYFRMAGDLCAKTLCSF